MGIRYLLMSVPYSTQLHFTLKGLQEADAALEKLRNFRRRVKDFEGEPSTNSKVQELINRASQDFEAAMNAMTQGTIFQIAQHKNCFDQPPILLEEPGELALAGVRLQSTDEERGGDIPTFERSGHACEIIPPLKKSRERIGKTNGIFVRASRERAPWSPSVLPASGHAAPTALPVRPRAKGSAAPCSTPGVDTCRRTG
jgi:hypothetical protein